MALGFIQQRLHPSPRRSSSERNKRPWIEDTTDRDYRKSVSMIVSVLKVCFQLPARSSETTLNTLLAGWALAGKQIAIFIADQLEIRFFQLYSCSPVPQFSAERQFKSDVPTISIIVILVSRAMGPTMRDRA